MPYYFNHVNKDLIYIDEDESLTILRAFEEEYNEEEVKPIALVSKSLITEIVNEPTGEQKKKILKLLSQGMKPPTLQTVVSNVTAGLCQAMVVKIKDVHVIGDNSCYNIFIWLRL